MSPSADAPSSSSLSEVLNFTSGQIVQEIGYDDDVDLELRDAIEDLIGGELEDEDTQEIVDAVVLWWREGDGDLTDWQEDVGEGAAVGAGLGEGVWGHTWDPMTDALAERYPD